MDFLKRFLHMTQFVIDVNRLFGDVQQYILCRLNQDYTLRQHIRRDTAAKMLNQLRIKSRRVFPLLGKVNGCCPGWNLRKLYCSSRNTRNTYGTLYGLY
jgi:hypothetical protein